MHFHMLKKGMQQSTLILILFLLALTYGPQPPPPLKIFPKKKHVRVNKKFMLPFCTTHSTL